MVFIALLSVVAGGAMLYFAYARSIGGTLRVEAAAYHLVIVSSFETKVQAESESTVLRQSGGAGYVFAGNNAFHVAASAYYSKRDAETVAERIENATVYTLSAPVLYLPFLYDGDKAKEYAAFFSYPRTLFDDLYRLSTELDESKITEAYAVLAVAGLKSRVYGQRTSLSGYADCSQYAELNELYTAIYDFLQDAQDYRYSSALAPNLKYALCGVADADIKCMLAIKSQL